MSLPPIEIRASRLPAYNDCGLRTAARIFPQQFVEYGWRVREISGNVGAAVGTGAHAGIAHLLEYKKEHGQAKPVDSETADRAEAEFVERIEYGITWDRVTPNKDIGIRQITRIVRAYAELVVPKVTPLLVEHDLTMATAAGNTIGGRIDLGADAVHDLKTGKYQGGNIAQYGCYSLLLRANGGKVNYIEEDYFRRLPLDKPQEQNVQRYDVSTAERIAGYTIKRMERDYAVFMETGDPMAFPANPGSILCGEKFCPLHGTETCQAHKEAR